MYSPFANASRISYLARNAKIGDSRECFCSTAEAEGLLVTDSYPFSLGSGSVSMEAFGLPIFFKSKVLGIALSSVSSDEYPDIEFELQHVSVSGVVSVIDTFSMDSNKFVINSIQSLVYQPGQICVKIKSVSGLTDDFAKYRIAIYLQSGEAIS
jgi:hypothetical protein